MTAVTDVEAEGALVALLVTPEGRADPYPHYKLMRDRAPVLRGSTGTLILTRYADCLATLRNPRFGRGVLNRDENDRSVLPGAADPAIRQEFFNRSTSNMLFADPPDHTRLRKLVNRAFTPRRVEQLRDSIQTSVDSILDRLAELGSADVMTELAFPLPVSVIGELVGVPVADRAGFQPIVRKATAGIEPFSDNAAVLAAMEAQDELRAYFENLLAERRRRPTDDMLSGLIDARESDDLLTDEEIMSTAILLFAAGFETTTNLIGNGLNALLNHPGELDRLRQDPALASTAVEELLRFDSPVQINSRTALEETELGGEAVPKNGIVMVLQGGANRDPQRFQDPDRLDISRSDNVPLSFGWGAHHCLGAPLARLEGEIVFASLAKRFGRIERAGGELEWKAGITLRGLTALPVDFAA